MTTILWLCLFILAPIIWWGVIVITLRIIWFVQDSDDAKHQENFSKWVSQKIKWENLYKASKNNRYFSQAIRNSPIINFEDICLPFTVKIECECGKINRVKVEKMGIYKCGNCSETVLNVWGETNV